MKFRAARSFWRDYERLPERLKDKADEAFRKFRDNPRDPAFRIHKIRGTSKPEIFEGYLTHSYRFTFEIEGDTYIFRRIGPHDIIDEEERSR